MANINNTRLSGFFGGGGGGGTPTNFTLQEVTTNGNQSDGQNILLSGSNVGGEIFSIENQVNESGDVVIVGKRQSASLGTFRIYWDSVQLEFGPGGSLARACYVNRENITWFNDNLTNYITLKQSPIGSVGAGITMPQNGGYLGLNQYPMNNPIDVYLTPNTTLNNIQENCSFYIYSSGLNTSANIDLNSSIADGTTMIFNNVVGFANPDTLSFSYNNGSGVGYLIGYPSGGYVNPFTITITRMGSLFYFSSFQS